jgi:hypothetical protein
MAVIALTSASGAPGVTTSALAIALAWPRPTLLLEADPTGGSAILAGWFQGTASHDRGLINLAMAHRHGDLVDALRDVTIRIPDSTVDLVAGIRSHAQAATVTPIWASLATALKAMERIGTDVIVDAGRLGMVGAPMPLLRQADVVLLTTRSSMPAVSGARSWAKTLHEDFTSLGAAENLGLLVVGQGNRYSAREIGGVLKLPVVSCLAWDPVSAEVFHLGQTPRKGFDDSSLTRSVRAAVSTIQAMVATNRSRLAHGNLVNAQEGI